MTKEEIVNKINSSTSDQEIADIWLSIEGKNNEPSVVEGMTVLELAIFVHANCQPKLTNAIMNLHGKAVAKASQN